MIDGFEKIVEERILVAQRQGAFDNLSGAGKPLHFEEDSHIPEELRIAYKILKNGDCLPPEIELKKEIVRTEELLADIGDAKEKYRAIQKLNYLIMKYNILRNTSVESEMNQRYLDKIVDSIDRGRPAVEKRG